MPKCVSVRPIWRPRPSTRAAWSRSGRSSAAAENGASKFSGEDYGFSFGVRVLAGERMVAPGYFGRSLGAADLDSLEKILREGIEKAYRRAMANGELKATVREKFGGLGDSLAALYAHLHYAPKTTTLDADLEEAVTICAASRLINELS